MSAQTETDSLEVWVDQDLCTGDGLCVQYAPEVFEFDIDGLAYVKDSAGELLQSPGVRTGVPARLQSPGQVHDGIRACDQAAERRGVVQRPGDDVVVDAGQFRLRVRAPDGTQIARTERYALDLLDLVALGTVARLIGGGALWVLASMAPAGCGSEPSVECGWNRISYHSNGRSG